jgi:homoserine O-acetyltransferase/O-succinyltransferase
MSLASAALGKVQTETRPRGPAIVATTDAVSYEVVGPPDAPVVVVLGGISASRHVTRSERDNRPGWWEEFVGAGKPIDTNSHRVLSIDYLTPRRKERPLSTHDQARALLSALDAAEIGDVCAVVGASYGGMVALAFGAIAPSRAAQLVVIGAAHESAPIATAIRLLQRRIVAFGILCGSSDEALVLARGLALSTYTTAEEFALRFASPDSVDPAERCRSIGEYLRASGERFAGTFTPQRFLALAESIDLHHVNPADVRVPTTLIAVREDALVPVSQARELAASLGAPCRLVEISSLHGHDTFLNAPDLIAPHVSSALTSAGLLQ